jgi:voltage-gated sodium channel
MTPDAPTPTPTERRPSLAQWFFTADAVVMVVIALNSIVLFLLAFEDLHHSAALELLDYAFTTYFVIEVLVKIRKLTLRGYFAQGWNRFDFVVVMISLPSYAMLFLPIPDLSYLLLLRAARTLKFLRFMHFVPDMPKLVDGAKRALRASSVVVLGFFVLNFIVALLSYHLFHPYSPEYFGNPLLAFYSIFKIFTVEGWYEIPDTIAEASNSAALGMFARMYFMGVVIGGGLLGLSLVNAIFVDEMLRDENDHLELRLDYVDRSLSELERKLDLLLERGGGEAPLDVPPGDPS